MTSLGGWGSVLVWLVLAVWSVSMNAGNGAEPSPSNTSTGEVGPYAKWAKIELGFPGPDATSTGSWNPFQVRLDVTFHSPQGQSFVVPGFYAGDGQGGPDGNQWQVRFSADEEGTWTFATKSDQPPLNGVRGQFRVTAVPAEARGFWKWGRLEYVGTPQNRLRYLRFRDGPYWMKAGCDDPENFLGKYAHFDTLEKRIASIDYLAGRGINSLYIMTHNIGGDDGDVWPWLGETTRQAQSHAGTDARFDVAKLEQWGQLFDYMQTKGVVPYLILEDDSAWNEYDHQRYHREMIARFGYLPALVLNLGEEHNENYTWEEGVALARQLSGLDPYGHALAIHNIGRATDTYVDASVLDMTSIQTGAPGKRSAVRDAVEHNQIAVDWIERCIQRQSRVLVVNFDEGRPEHDRRSWWSAYLGGGVWEAHVVPPYDQPHRTWDDTWAQLGGARAFMEMLPFHQMAPRNDLVRSGQAFCLAKIGEVYAFYLPAGGSVTVQLQPGLRYRGGWWDPSNANDGSLQDAFDCEGGEQTVRAPAAGDWALRIVKAGT